MEQGENQQIGEIVISEADEQQPDSSFQITAATSNTVGSTGLASVIFGVDHTSPSQRSAIFPGENAAQQ